MTEIKVEVIPFRHGTANYSQKVVGLAEANDLKEEGVVGVQQSVERLMQEIDRSELIEIRSSPFGRTLQTARIIFDTLQSHGFDFSPINNSIPVKAENVIRIDPDIDEVRNFDLNLFKAFVFGGEVDGIQILKDNTNPRDLSFPEYFNTRAWKDADAPSALIKKLDKTERTEDTSARFEAKLREIANRDFRVPTLVILVTHLDLMCDFTDTEVKPADFFTVDPSDFL